MAGLVLAVSPGSHDRGEAGRNGGRFEKSLSRNEQGDDGCLLSIPDDQRRHRLKPAPYPNGVTASVAAFDRPRHRAQRDLNSPGH